MTKTSWRKMSILGVVLVAASAVTAAVLPNKPASMPNNVDGSLTKDSDALTDLSCTASVGTPDQACTVTAGSLTTTAVGGGAIDSVTIGGGSDTSALAAAQTEDTTI